MKEKKRKDIMRRMQLRAQENRTLRFKANRPEELDEQPAVSNDSQLILSVPTMSSMDYPEPRSTP